MNDTHGETGKGWYGFDADNGGLLARLRLELTGFLVGSLIGAILAMLTIVGVEAYDKWFGPEKEPARARVENTHKALNDLLNDRPEVAR